MKGVNAFLDALSELAHEINPQLILGPLRKLQEAVAHDMEVDAVMEAENKKTTRRRGDVQVVRLMEEDPMEEMGG